MHEMGIKIALLTFIERVLVETIDGTRLIFYTHSGVLRSIARG
jgi:hypothetical protein